MNDGRKRNRRGGRIAVLLLAVAAAALIWTWPRGGNWARQLLTGQRPGQERPLALEPLASPKPEISTLTARPQEPADAGTEASPQTPQASETQPENGPSPNTPAPPQPSPEPADQPALPLVRLAAPTTQPAGASTFDETSRQAGAEDLAAGLALLRENKLLQARQRLNQALRAGLSASEAETARNRLQDLADRTLFNKAVLEEDPLVTRYVVTSGDTVGRLARRAKISGDLLAEINDLSNKNFIREGQTLKLLKGPFHVTISKKKHEMYVFLQDTYVRTFRVALGEDGSTPKGLWRAINHLENPEWVDRRTRKKWHPDDPDNPIGEHWIGLEGVEGECVGQIGYGIHGTIEPETIGQDVSMGCVRLQAEDIAFVYKLLLPGESMVQITD